ncbi:MAG TPA: hypothetical protein VGC84_05705 [Ilumatobacteraceae bacterium]|jgi:hypothetical protein
MSERPSDEAIWASVAQTLRRTVLPYVSDPQARSATIQLIGLATYASRRGPDVEGERIAELTKALGGAAGQDLMRSCFAVLADPDHPAHEDIRSIFERHLEQDLASEEALLQARRGQVPGG